MTKVLITTDGWENYIGVYEGPNPPFPYTAYRIKLIAGPLEFHKDEPFFITELTLFSDDFILLGSVGEVLYE